MAIGRARYRFEDDQFRMGQRIKDTAIEGINLAINQGKRQLIAAIIIGGIYSAATPIIWTLSFPATDWVTHFIPGFRQ